MNDDFDSPRAIAVIFDLARAINRAKSDNAARADLEAGAISCSN